MHDETTQKKKGFSYVKNLYKKNQKKFIENNFLPCTWITRSHLTLTWNCLNGAQMVSIIQQIHVQHYLSITGKKCLSRRYDHSLSRRLQTTWEVSLDVVSFILTAHLHGLRHVHIWKACSFQQQSNSVSVYMCSRGSRQKC